MSKRVCSVAGCVIPSRTRGWCSMHYQRMLVRGTTDKWSGKSICSVTDCGRTTIALGYCNAHYKRVKDGRALDTPIEVKTKEHRPCSVADCSNLSRALGWCRKHYKRMKTRGSTDKWSSKYPSSICSVFGCVRISARRDLCRIHHEKARTLNNPLCKIDGCGSHARDRNLCNMHYQQVKKYGTHADDKFTCGGCGDAVSRLKEGMRSSALLCRKCQVLNIRTNWCMTTVQIAKRDGTDCSLCDEPVDFTLIWPNLMSPTIDHILPRSRGGKDLPENIALAHFSCNRRKWTGTEVAA